MERGGKLTDRELTLISFTRQSQLYGGYPPEFNYQFKRYIRRREDHLCAICKEKKRLDVHHIDYIKAHTIKENCVAICRECHKEIHASTYRKKCVWRSRLTAFVRKQEADYGQKHKKRSRKSRKSTRKITVKAAKIQAK